MLNLTIRAAVTPWQELQQRVRDLEVAVARERERAEAERRRAERAEEKRAAGLADGRVGPRRKGTGR